MKGKVVLVTGSTRGIGWATACELARRGATVLLNGHSDREALDSRVEELRQEHGGEVDGLFFDVADSQALGDAFRQVFRRHRRLDVLVNNAGILEDALIGMIGEELVDRTLAVNVKAPVLALQAAARLMMRGSGGAIVNVSSIIGLRGNAGQAVYAASKAALVGLTLSAAKELAPKGIRVNAVAPGFIDTDMIAHLPRDLFDERIGLGRVGSPEEVARTIAFLASDDASYVTGQILGVDGSMLV